MLLSSTVTGIINLLIYLNFYRKVIENELVDTASFLLNFTPSCK